MKCAASASSADVMLNELSTLRSAPATLMTTRATVTYASKKSDRGKRRMKTSVKRYHAEIVRVCARGSGGVATHGTHAPKHAPIFYVLDSPSRSARTRVIGRRTPAMLPLSVHRHWKRSERAVHVSPTAWKIASPINEHMRAILVDWMWHLRRADVVNTEALHLAVQLIDRFVHARSSNISRSKLQLYGIVALLSAHKMRNSRRYRGHLTADIATRLCANAYSKPDVIEGEWELLSTLKFRVASPTARDFAWLYAKGARQLAMSIADQTLHTCAIGGHTPSLVGASIAYVSLVHQRRAKTARARLHALCCRARRPAKELKDFAASHHLASYINSEFSESDK